MIISGGEGAIWDTRVRWVQGQVEGSGLSRGGSGVRFARVGGLGFSVSGSGWGVKGQVGQGQVEGGG